MDVSAEETKIACVEQFGSVAVSDGICICSSITGPGSQGLGPGCSIFSIINDYSLIQNFLIKILTLLLGYLTNFFMKMNRNKFEEMITSLNKVIEKYNLQHKSGVDFGTGDLLHPAEIHTLQFIGDNPLTTITLLSEKLGVTKATVSERVKKLLVKDLVMKKKSSHSGRDVFIELTARGKKAYDGHEKHHARLFRYFCDYLGDDVEKQIDRFDKSFKDYLEIMEYVQKKIKNF